MKSRVGGVVVLLVTAACSVHIVTDAHAEPPSVAARSPRTVAQALKRRGIGRGTVPQVTRPAPAPTPTTGKLGAMALRPAGAATAGEPVNVAKLQAIAKRQPKACGVYEVAPGVWTRIDCQMYSPSSKAIASLSPRKLKLIKAHKTLWKPMKSVASAVRGSFQRGGTTLIRPGGGGAPSTAAGGGGNDPPGIIVAESFPGTVDHRSSNLEGPIKSQGAVGSCTAFALSAVVDNAAIRAGKLQGGDRSGATSPNHVWSGYGIPNMGAAADSNIARPLATMGIWDQNNPEACKLAMSTETYREDCGEAYGVKAGSWRNDGAVKAKYDRANASGLYKIAYIEKMSVRPPNMEEVVSAIASGQDLWVAFMIDGSKWTNYAMKNGVIPDYDDYSGGHAVSLSGYRDTPSGRQFLIHNSWGTGWGDNGYAWISERMVQKWMYYSYKVKISGGVKDPTDDDCAPDELVDATTNECAIMCEPDGSRPNNGCGRR